MNAVIYARFSSAGQRDESIEGQLRECNEYADRKGISVVGTYVDRAYSATTDQRPDFQRMIRDSAKGTFDAVLCWKHDRFARNRYDAALYKAKLKANGVQVMYAREELPDGPQGIIVDSIMEGFAEYYSANLSENVKRGMYESALKRQTMGVRCLGLTEGEDKRFVHDENAPVVKRIFEEYVAGRPAKDICADLNREGFRTYAGKPFGRSSLGSIISNPKYYGLYEYKDIHDENGIPPIVTKELWMKAQKVAKEHAEAPARKPHNGGFLLSGKLFCGHCGHSMTAGSGTSRNGTVYDYYACDGRRREKNGCEKKNIPKKQIEDVVVNALRDLVFSDEFIAQATDYFMEWQSLDDHSAEMHALEEKLKDNERAITNLTKSLEVYQSESVILRIRELETERKDIEYGLAKYKLDNPTFTREQINYFLTNFREGDVNDPSWREYLVRSFLNRVYAYDDGRYILHLNINGEGKELTLSDIEECSKLGDSPVPRSANLNTFSYKGEMFAIIIG